MSRSACNCSESANLVMARYAAVLSAKKSYLRFNLVWQVIYVDQEEDWPKDRSLMLLVLLSEQSPSRTTLCDLPFRNALIQVKVLPLIP